MAKKEKTKEAASRSGIDTVLDEARARLAEKGYRVGKEHPYKDGKSFPLFQSNGKAELLLVAVDPATSIDEHQGRLAVLAAMTISADNLPPYVHVTNGAEFIHVPSHQRRGSAAGGEWASEPPRTGEDRIEGRPISGQDRRKRARGLRELAQQQFDNIHEASTPRAKNVSSSNEAIDELAANWFTW